MNSLQLLKHLPALKAIQAERCRRSFFYFVQTFWSTIIAEEPVWNWHMEYLCHELQAIAQRVKRREPAEYTFYIINIPPGCSKSTLCSQMYVAWTWVIDPTQRFICGSYSQTIARKDATFTQSIVQSDLYREMFPDVKLDKEAVDLIRNTQHGERYATSVGAGITGIHAHQILIDDPLNPRQASSEAERNAANTWLDQTLATRKVDKKITPTILVMQRLHALDPTGYLLNKNARVKHICLPAECSGQVRPAELASRYVDGLLDPVRMDRAVLADMRLNIGSYAYAGQFAQQPAPDAGGLLKKAWFRTFSMEQLCDAEGRPWPLVWNVVCDTAYTADQSNDPSGMLAYAYYENNWYIRGWQSLHLEFPELCRALPAFALAQGYTPRSVIAVEPKASGKSLVQTLRRNTGLNILEDAPPSKDKVARIQDIAPTIEAGRVHLLGGAAWVEHFLTELSQFPNAAHDEAADCLVMAIHRHQNARGMLSFAVV